MKTTLEGELSAQRATNFTERSRSTVAVPFSKAMETARNLSGGPGLPLVRVRDGDTLTGIVRDRLAATGRSAGPAQLMALAQQVAEANRIADPDRIFVGDTVDLSTLDLSETPRGPTLQAHTKPDAPPDSRPAAARASATNAVFDRTLARAVEKGYLTAGDQDAVRERVLSMAQRYGFAPDDFARVALMESDGFNPQASNGRCHGIIQFCEGSGRGAASVGMEGRAKDILGKGVLEQLELVERYFEDAGLRRVGPQVGLADLYLTVLTPAAREERAPSRALSIPGTQARLLHEDGDRRRPITRNSIVEGLTRNARLRLAESVSGTESLAGKGAASERQALAARSVYQAVSALARRDGGG